MRIAEAYERYRYLEETRIAIAELSRANEHRDPKIWEYAAQWREEFTFYSTSVKYMAMFGYKATAARVWAVNPSVGVPEMQLSVDSHNEAGGHTWYQVQCSLAVGEELGNEHLQWPCMRRLVQLRRGLHNPIKAELGDAYIQHYNGTPFAKIGGPKGTTSRLQQWLSTLARIINQGKVPPSVVNIALRFFFSPKPKAAIMVIEDSAEKARKANQDSMWEEESIGSMATARSHGQEALQPALPAVAEDPLQQNSSLQQETIQDPLQQNSSLQQDTIQEDVSHF